MLSLCKKCLGNNKHNISTQENTQENWKSVDEVASKQTDHKQVNLTFRTSVRDKIVLKSANTESEHYVICTSIKLKF